ncbi:MAG: amidase [Alphaproteobacteria bacterium]|nr:amidase [Alphaproteobacteria bacterium]
MAVKIPTELQIMELADEMGLDLTSEDIESYINLLTPNVEAYNIIDAMPDNLPGVKYPRTPGYQPRAEENPYNAWYVKTEVKGSSSGKLKGKTVVLKDNVMLAGVPMMNGAATLEGYIPDVDATIATRLLDAGATIVGKAHCENFCLSGGSHTNAKGAVHNPHKMGYSAGGSSSGSAALLAAGEVDLAIGGDQGGSIRMPASFCGVYGMKATHGLVPYTGIMPIEIYVDHTGPMTNSVEDNALMLEVLAGEDGYDPRQYNVKTQKYTNALKGKKGIKGMKIAVVKEGFMQENAEKDVNTKVKAAIQKLKSMGAIVKEVSIPMHLLGPALWLPIGVEGLTQTMMYGDGYGVSRPDLYVTSLMDFHRNWRNRANEMSETTKLLTMLGTYIRKNHGSRYYGKAMNITRLLTAAYDNVLNDYDLLVMPTTALKATPLPAPDASREEYVQKALEMISNTAPFDITHHPAMAIPCGMSKGLPVSMMLVGKHFEESTIYQAAHAFESATDWKKM